MGCQTEKDLRSDGNSRDFLSDWFFMWHLIELRALFPLLLPLLKPLITYYQCQLIEGNGFIQSTQNHLLCLLFALLRSTRVYSLGIDTALDLIITFKAETAERDVSKWDRKQSFLFGIHWVEAQSKIKGRHCSSAPNVFSGNGTETIVWIWWIWKGCSLCSSGSG